MLSGATEKIKIGLPNIISTDIGPVIDQTAKDKIDNHINIFKSKVLAQSPLDNEKKGKGC